MSNELFVVKIYYDGDAVIGYAGGFDYVVYEIQRATLFRVEDIATEVRDELRLKGHYGAKIEVVKVDAKDVL